MQEKLKRLDKLLSILVSEVKKLKQENVLLKKQVEAMEKENEKLRRGTIKLREFEEWRRMVKKRISKICLRIDKITDLEDNLFSDYET